MHRNYKLCFVLKFVCGFCLDQWRFDMFKFQAFGLNYGISIGYGSKRNVDLTVQFIMDAHIFF